MQRIVSHKALAAICLTSLLTLSGSLSMQASAQQNTQEASQGLPGRRVGGGTRGEEQVIAAKPLMALVPENNLGLTAAASPTLFFYMPKTSTPQKVEFVLNNANDETVYETTFMTPSNSGVISVTLPATVTKLEVGKNYHWYLSVIHNPDNRAEDSSVDGWIKRVETSPALASNVEEIAPIDRANLYASNDLWQDALATLAELRRSHPSDTAIAGKWAQLLQSAKLGEIAQEPLVDYQQDTRQSAVTPSASAQ